MTALQTFESGDRLRIRVDETTYASAPIEARDPQRFRTIHIVSEPVVGGAALDGARWALSWSLSQLFGDSLATLLEMATLENVERWNGSSWELVA